MLGAELLHTRKTGADFNRFHRINAHHRERDGRIKPVINRLAPTDRHTACHHVNSRAAAFARFAKFVHIGFE